MTSSCNNVEIYLVFLPDEASQNLASFLSTAEQQRAFSIKHPLARLRFETGRVHLRQLLGHRLGIAPSDVRIAIGRNGKPGLANGSGRATYHFSISHSGDWVGIAVSDEPIGLDLETRCPPRWEVIARRFFSEFELEWLEQAESGEDAFVALWTMKEAAVKLSADTLLAGLRDFELLVEGPGLGLATDDYMLAANCRIFDDCWLSAAIHQGRSKKDTLFSINLKTKNGGWLVSERLLNQYPMTHSRASA